MNSPRAEDLRDRVPARSSQTKRDPELLDRRPGALEDLPDDRRDRSAARAAPRAAVSAVAARRRRCGRRRARVRRRTDGAESAAAASTAASFPAAPPRREGLSPLRHTTFISCAPRRRRATRRDSLRVNVVEPSAVRHAEPAVARARWPSTAASAAPTARTSSSTSTTSRSPTATRSRSSGVSLDIYKNAITALIGPSGCGKSTVPALPQPDERPRAERARRAAACSTTASTSTAPDVDPIEVRRRIGMVFQRPNPFPKSIYDNVAYGLRILGMKDNLDDRVEQALAPRGDLGRGQEPAQALGARPLGRPAAAALHRARDRGRARRRPARRARVGARPDLDAGDRGPDARAEAATTRS